MDVCWDVDDVASFMRNGLGVDVSDDSWQASPLLGRLVLRGHRASCTLSVLRASSRLISFDKSTLLSQR